MEEVENQSKNSLAVQYIISSIMVIGYIMLLGLVMIIFEPVKIIDQNIRFGVTLGFISFMFIMAYSLINSLTNLFDAIFKLNNGEYY